MNRKRIERLMRQGVYRRKGRRNLVNQATEEDLVRRQFAVGRPGPSGPWAALVAARSGLALEMEDAGPLRAVTRGVVPLRLCVTRRLTCFRCLPFLLASQTALTPSANPLGKPGLHHAHLPLLHGRAMPSHAGRIATPPADPGL